MIRSTYLSEDFFSQRLKLWVALFYATSLALNLLGTGK
jgi:hypothetical protein